MKISETTIARIKRINARNKADGHAHRIHAYEESTVSGMAVVFYIYDTTTKQYLHHRTVDVSHSIHTLTYYRCQEKSKRKALLCA